MAHAFPGLHQLLKQLERSLQPHTATSPASGPQSLPCKGPSGCPQVQSPPSEAVLGPCRQNYQKPGENGQRVPRPKG